MKENVSFALFLFVFCIIVMNAIHTSIASQKVEFYIDLDEVLLEQSYVIPYLILGGIAQNPSNGFSYVSSLLGVQQAYSRDTDGIKEALYDKNNNAIEGITFHFLHHGMRDKKLAPYVSWLIQTMERKRHFIEKTKDICNYLKQKGHHINFATNKDRLAYDITAQTFGKTLTDIVHKVFVAHPGNSQTFLDDLTHYAQQKTTPENYKQLAHKALHIQPSGNIIHIPSRKPEPAYYHHMIQQADADAVKVFIDDKKTNVDGFLTLQNTSKSKLYGIHFKNPQQFVQELVKYGFLSENEDREFLKKIYSNPYYPRIIILCAACIALGTLLLLCNKYFPLFSSTF